MWKRSGKGPIEAQADELTVECEELLAGRYAEYLGAHGRGAPPWGWLNVLAHAPEAELSTWASEDSPHQRGDLTATKESLQALSFLAEDILRHVASTGVTLAQLQQSTLIPLELELLRGADGYAPNPGQLAGRVLAAVHRNPSRPQR